MLRGNQRSYVESRPTHLLSGSPKCGSCGGAIALASGKGSGYYGCLSPSRRSCENKVLISRKRLEDNVVAALNDEVLKPDVLEAVYERTAKKIKAHFSQVPEELRLKKIELNRAKTRAQLHRVRRLRARDAGTRRRARSAEEQVKMLAADHATMTAAKDHAFSPPPAHNRRPHRAPQRAPRCPHREVSARAPAPDRRGHADAEDARGGLSGRLSGG